MDWRSMGKKWQLRLVAIAIALGVIGSFRLWDSSSPISFTVPEPASKSLHKSKTPLLLPASRNFP